MAEELYSATGKRKTSVARIWMKPGNGEIRINKKTAEEYLVQGGRQDHDHVPASTGSDAR